MPPSMSFARQGFGPTDPGAFLHKRLSIIHDMKSTRSARPGKRLHERILHPLGEVLVGADQPLTDLDLDAEVSVRGEPPAQRGGEAVGSPAVGMVPPYGGLRQAELERTAPFA